MTNLEKYLRNATRGTYGKTRALIRNELEANIRLRGKELEHHGLNELEAITRALEELGAANLVSTGMTGVYIMPKITRVVLPIAFAMTAIVIVLSISRAQIETTSVGTIPECNFATVNTGSNFVPCILEGNWFKFSSFKTELEQKGGTVENTSKMMKFSFPGDRTFSIPNFTNLPQNGSTTFEQKGETFFLTYAVIGTVAEKSNLPVKLEGFVNPRLTVGETSINFGSSETPVKTSFFRFSNLQTQLQKDFQNAGFKLNKLTESNNNLEFRRLTICCNASPKIYAKVNDTPGTIYAAIQQRYNYKFLIDISEVKADGKLEFMLDGPTAYFVNGFKKLKAGRGETVLLRLTNRIDARAKQYQIAPLPTKL